jgi:hypothetical protein
MLEATLAYGVSRQTIMGSSGKSVGHGVAG